MARSTDCDSCCICCICSYCDSVLHLCYEHRRRAGHINRSFELWHWALGAPIENPRIVRCCILCTIHCRHRSTQHQIPNILPIVHIQFCMEQFVICTRIHLWYNQQHISIRFDQQLYSVVSLWTWIEFEQAPNRLWLCKQYLLSCRCRRNWHGQLCKCCGFGRSSLVYNLIGVLSYCFGRHHCSMLHYMYHFRIYNN